MKSQVGDANKVAGAGVGFVRELLRVPDLLTLGHLAAREAHRSFSIPKLALVWWSRTSHHLAGGQWLAAPDGQLSDVDRNWLAEHGPPGRKADAPFASVDLVAGVMGRAALIWPLAVSAPSGPEWIRFAEDLSGVAG